MGRAHKVVPCPAGEAVGALMPSPHSPRGTFHTVAAPSESRQLRRAGMRPRHARIGLETVLEEDPSLGSEVDEELFLPSSGFESYLTFMRQIKSDELQQLLRNNLKNGNVQMNEKIHQPYCKLKTQPARQLHLASSLMTTTN
ncbi:hypothetical protein KSP40_PGU008199 [Platanthera guangdongensis]|uniref:Uncharacterized protein n=1 Tax=Platanthera guangdongensis TaxID=2320717 RepID=A0ABR2MPK5_9ASPA